MYVGFFFGALKSPNQVRTDIQENVLVILNVTVVTFKIKDHSEAQIVNFRRWSSIPDIHFWNSHSSSLEYPIHGYK